MLFLKFLRQGHPGIILHTITQTLNQVPKELFVGAPWCIALHFGARFIWHFCLKSEFVSCLWQTWQTLVSTWTLRHLTALIIDSTVTRWFNEEWPLLSQVSSLETPRFKNAFRSSPFKWWMDNSYNLISHSFGCFERGSVVHCCMPFGFGGGDMFMIPCTKSIGWCFPLPYCSYPINKSSVHLVESCIWYLFWWINKVLPIHSQQMHNKRGQDA